MESLTLWGETEAKTLPDDTCEKPDERHVLTITEKVGEFQRRVMFRGAYKCSKPPRAGPSHGIGAMNVAFALVGPKGAVQWLISTGWYTRSTAQPSALAGQRYPEALDIGYHSPTPQYDGQDSVGECELLGGRPCYYSGSTLNAAQFTPDFLTHPGAIWEALEKEYKLLGREASLGENCSAQERYV